MNRIQQIDDPFFQKQVLQSRRLLKNVLTSAFEPWEMMYALPLGIYCIFRQMDLQKLSFALDYMYHTPMEKSIC